MQIEKEIRLPRYESVFHEAMVNVAFTHNWCSEQLKNAVQPYEITAQQFNVLRILRGQYPSPSTINLVRCKMLDKMCDASRIVERLLQKELVAKRLNSKDKRSVDILISKKGLDLLERMDGDLNLSGVLSSHLTAVEAEQLVHLLKKAKGG